MDLGEFIDNPGLEHIGVLIVRHLDTQSVAKCREVSRPFQELIDGQKFWYIRQIQKGNCFKGHWQTVLNTYDESKPLFELKIVARLWTAYMLKKDFAISPFFFAVKENDINFVKLLINSPYIYFGSRDNDGNTIFHHACAHGLTEMLELIFQEFGNVIVTDNGKKRNENMLDNDSDSEWADATDSEDDNAEVGGQGFWDLINGPDLPSDDNYDVHDDSSSYESITDEDYDSSTDEDDDGDDDSENEHELLRIMIDARKKNTIEPYFGFTNKQGKTPLHLAVENGHTEVMRLLYTKLRWVVPDKRDRSGRSIVHKACFAGNDGVVKLLMAHLLQDDQSAQSSELASVCGESGFGRNDNAFQTPLHLACMQGHFHIVKLLIQNAEKLPLKVDSTDKYGKLPIQLLVEQEQNPINDDDEKLSVVCALAKMMKDMPKDIPGTWWQMFRSLMSRWLLSGSLMSSSRPNPIPKQENQAPNDPDQVLVLSIQYLNLHSKL